MRIWQIATGEPGRDYRELFLEHDVMLLGPGDWGDPDEVQYDDGVPNSAGNQVDRFVHLPSQGDRVLMRFGKEVIGVGQIPHGDDSGYCFDKTFRAVYGWDLSHSRRVVWAEDLELGELARVYQKAKQKPSFTEVHESHILRMAREIEEGYFDRPIREKPSTDTSEYSPDDLGVDLFRAGISNKNIQDILSALQQAERLSSWYWSGETCGRSPSENEVISHMILPLFLGLGWSHQQIAVEWYRVDMAFFKMTPTVAKNCRMVLEAKGLGKPLSEVLHQPKRYVADLKLDHVRYIVTTDGADLYVYERSKQGWDANPVGYLSIRCLQREYLLPKKCTAIKTLVMLQPSAV